MHFRVKYDHFLSFAARQYLHQIALCGVGFILLSRCDNRVESFGDWLGSVRCFRYFNMYSLCF